MDAAAPPSTDPEVQEDRAPADPYGRRLPGYFPLIARGCEPPAVRFFKCFSVEAELDPNRLDPRAGDRALVRCRRELDAYEACMGPKMGQNLQQGR